MRLLILLMLKLLKIGSVQTRPLAISEEDYNYDRQINDNSLDYHHDNNKSDNQLEIEKNDQNDYEIDNLRGQSVYENDFNNDNQLNDVLQEFYNVDNSDDIFKENIRRGEVSSTEERNKDKQEKDIEITHNYNENTIDEVLKTNDNLDLWDHKSGEEILDNKYEHNVPYNHDSFEVIVSSYENNDKIHDSEIVSNNNDASQNEELNSEENHSSNESN